METLIKKGAEEITCSCCGSSVDAKPCRKFFSKVAEQEYSLHHCSECDLMFWMPLEIRPELYDNQAFGYIDFHYGLRRELPYYSKAFFESIPLKRGLLLDVGGGEGLFALEAAKKGFDTYMLDFDKKSIEMARTMGVANAFAGSLDDFLEHCKQKNIQFDVITFFEVLEHQDNIQSFINSIQQILKPGGWIAGSTPNRERAFAEITRTSDGQDTPPHHFFWWNKKSLKKFFQLNSFEMEIFPTKVSLEDATAHLIDILLGNTIKKLKNRIVANKQNNIEIASTEKIKRSQKIVLSFMRHIRHISLLPFGIILKLIYEKKGGVSFYFQGQKINYIHRRKYNRYSSEKVKILFVIDHLDGGGAEKQCLNVVNNIDRAGFEPCLFLTEKQGILFKKLAPGIKTFGMLNSEHRNTVKTLFQLKRTLSAFRPHIVHSWADYSSFITAFTLKTMHNPPMFIATQLGSREEVYNYEVSFGRLKKKLLIWSYTKADLVTTCAKSIKNQLKHYGINNVTVIYDGIDIEHLMNMPSKDYLREKLSLDRNIIYISYVGALVERKGVSCLIEAFKNLKPGNTALLIIGKGSQEDYLKKVAAGNDRIKFLGYRTNAAEYIKASDIFALPSVHEGLPNVILEAMAVGTPVIATNVYGIPELIENGVNGLLIPPKDAKNLARVIEQIIDTPEIAKRYADASFEKVRFFNIKRMVGEYEKLYLRSIRH